MQDAINQFLPSLASFGLWGYWIVAAAALAQGFAPTSLISPASVLVVFAGGLCAQGVYDFFDMAWFVATADAIGAILSWHLGLRLRRAHQKAGNSRFLSEANLLRGQALFQRFGAAGILLGRFLPMGAFVPLVAGLAGMEGRRFHLWNLLGAVAYALAALAVGYFFGSFMGLLSASATRIGALALALLGVLVLVWVLMLRLLKAVPFLRSVGRSILEALAQNPDMRALIHRHPRTARFLAARLNTAQFSGLPSTLFAAVFVYFAWAYSSNVLDVLHGGVIVQIDKRLAALLYAMRDSAGVAFFGQVSAFGNWQSVAVLAAAMSLLLGLGRQWRQIALIWLVPIGASATTAGLKLLFARPRPDVALYQMSDYSFPSGHATGAMAFFALAAWLLIRNGWARPMATVLSAATLIFLIGFSRLYLGVHYLSDVFNGYLVGAMWVLAGTWWLEGRGEGQRTPVPAVWIRLAVLVAGVALALVAGNLPQRAPRQVAQPEVSQLHVPVDEAFASGALPRYSETLLGKVAQPISLVVLAPDRADLIRAFQAADWHLADPPNIANMAHAATAAWFNNAYDTAPMTPAFWQARPHDLGFQQARQGAADTLRQRHHARFWASERLSQDGLMIFVGTASYDDGLKWGLTHHIDPNVDAERDFLAQSLLETGLFEAPQTLPLTLPVLGQNMVGDAFFTDGNAILLRWK